ncbi:uncharacterized protein LOC115627881 [Scaptodrosophila lebanonensis]|uniref:Uncharacterized protein LOC115627881 n=1 Tax=Drosophila lebanonensis TaxID=7225 RepID=A0A6J2TXJ7_DROLE|nr:uncharacterized protein LOC115627881 [Scaptodrosophila lebanonensis]
MSKSSHNCAFQISVTNLIHSRLRSSQGSPDTTMDQQPLQECTAADSTKQLAIDEHTNDAKPTERLAGQNLFEFMNGAGNAGTDSNTSASNKTGLVGDNANTNTITATNINTNARKNDTNNTDIESKEHMPKVMPKEEDAAQQSTTATSAAISPNATSNELSNQATTTIDGLNSVVAISHRNEFAKLLMRMGEEGDGDANQIVMELLNTKTEADKTSVIERVSENLMHVLRAQTLIDAGIITGNERYRCFKSVIQNYAKLHAAKKFIEKLSGLSPEPEVGGEQKMLARMVADEVLQIPELLRQLWSSLEKMEFFNEDTAFKVYLEARTHPQAKILRELMLTRISRVFLCIVSSTSFLEFSEHELVHVLKNCYLSVNSEIEIFLSVVLWLEHNWYERKSQVEHVLSGVRFSLMPTWYLSTLDRTNRCSHFARVTNMKCVQNLLDQGLADAMALRGNMSHFSFTKKVEKPMPRDWIADPECGHHHKVHCERFVYPTYEVFKQYLVKIIRCAPNYWRTLRPAQEIYRKVLKCCAPPHYY